MIEKKYIIGPVSDLVPTPVKGEEFICVIQKYIWWRGSDLAVWRRLEDGRCIRSVYATGPVNVDILPPECRHGVAPEEVGLLFQAAVDELAEEFSDVLNGKRLDWHECLAAALSPLRDDEVELPADEFDRIKSIAFNAHEGCAILGCEYGWTIAANTSTLVFEADSCSGRNEKFLEAAHQLVQIAELQDLPSRQLSLASILKQLRIESASL